MKIHALKLKKGEDILLSIEKFSQAKNISAGAVLSGVGDLCEARLVHGTDLALNPLKEDLEITGLNGAVSAARTHLHITLAKKDLSVIGGHLAHGCIAENGVEIILAEFEPDEVVSPETTDGAAADPNEYDSLVAKLFQGTKK